MKIKVKKNKTDNDIDVQSEVQDYILKLGLDKISAESQIIPNDAEDSKVKKVAKKRTNKYLNKEQQELIPNNAKDSKVEKFAKKKTNKYLSKEQQDKKKVKTVQDRPHGNFNNTLQQKQIPLLKPGRWNPDEFPNDPTEFEPIDKKKEKELEELARKLMDEEISIYKKQMETKKSSTYNWLKTASSKGTSGDKMAAFVMLVHESNIHNFPYVSSLISLLHKEKRRSLEALDTMKALFLEDLLPQDKKLRSFNQHPLGELDKISSGNKDSKHKRLLNWYYEATLKKIYSDFIQTMETLSKDTVDAVRKKATAIMWELLCEHPEQEKLLLSMLVNKLGDPSTKIASNAVNLLQKLMERHRRMNVAVTLETERLLHRPNISLRAQFYAICLLSSMRLQRGESELACRLVDIYFEFFKVYVMKGEIESKMLSALLSGVHKAFPYAKDNKEKILSQTEALYKICHMPKLSTSIQALRLIQEVIDVSDKACDRFYILLYQKLRDPELVLSKKLPLFLNLLCKSMKNDISDKRIQAFVKRLLQVSLSMPPHFVCSVLSLLSEVVKEKPNLLKLEKSSEEDDSDDEEHFIDQEDGGEGDVCKSDDEDVDMKSEEASQGKKDENKAAAKSSWMHKNNINYRLDHYDLNHRNPLYCRAELECVYELKPFLEHVHPTIPIFTQSLIKGESINYSGDPLVDFTWMRVINKFNGRNPKQALEEIEGKKTVDSKKKKSKRGKFAEDESVDDDQEVDIAADVDKDFDFGSDFGDEFGKDDDLEDLKSDEDDEESEIDEISEDDDDNDSGEDNDDDDDDSGEDDDDDDDETGPGSEKVIKQVKWEEARERGAIKRKRGRASSSKGNKAKRRRK